MRMLLCEENIDLALEIRKNIELVEEACIDERIQVIEVHSVIDMYSYLDSEDGVVDAIVLNMNYFYKRIGDGIKVAREIINEYKNIGIIFYTDRLELRQDIFDIKPIYVFQLPIIKNNMCTVIKKIYDDIVATRKECFVIKGIDALYRIRKDRVVYIESQGRYVHINTNEEQIVTISKMEHIMELLGDNFIQCHKSFVVNANKIKKMEHSKIVMFNGMEIQISRKYQSLVKEAMTNYGN